MAALYATFHRVFVLALFRKESRIFCQLVWPSHLKGICSAEPSSVSVVKLDDVDFFVECQIAHRCFLELLVDAHVQFNIIGLDQFHLKIYQLDKIYTVMIEYLRANWSPVSFNFAKSKWSGAFRNSYDHPRRNHFCPTREFYPLSRFVRQTILN